MLRVLSESLNRFHIFEKVDGILQFVNGMRSVECLRLYFYQLGIGA
jgi:hypothetical protein